MICSSLCLWRRHRRTNDVACRPGMFLGIPVFAEENDLPIEGGTKRNKKGQIRRRNSKIGTGARSSSPKGRRNTIFGNWSMLQDLFLLTKKRDTFVIFSKIFKISQFLDFAVMFCTCSSVSIRHCYLTKKE